MKKRSKPKSKSKYIVESIILLILAAVMVLLFWVRGVALEMEESKLSVQESSQPTETAAEVSSSPAATPTPTPTPTPEPTPEYFTISMVGDCTLWSSSQFENSDVGLPKTVGEDYSYPFSNTVEYFKDDEYTLANFECTLSDTKLSSSQMFYFLAPTSYANIMTEGGVDFVTTANNHSLDFGETGLQNTMAALDAVGLPYGTEDQYQIVTTPNGLKLGIYTAGNDMRPDWKQDSAVAAITAMKEQGADYIICMFHWGSELYYTPDTNQTTLAHACIDAGANLIYGSHPHCLEPIEEYNGGLIAYSLGNWVFGGSTRPSDPDTAIIQVTLKRDVDGSVTTDSYTAIPCCVSSNLEGAANMSDNYNNYCPTPYEEDSEAYTRAMSKLDGTYEAKSQGADYSSWYSSWG